MNDSFLETTRMFQEQARRGRAMYESQIALPHLLSADATFEALKSAVEELSKSAPADHDVVIQAFDLTVSEVRYIKPHSLRFHGINDSGHQSFVIAHFSQLVAHVVYLPKRGPSRVITGFAKEAAA